MTAPLAFDDRGAGPAVVLIHGHPFNRSMWALQHQALSGRFRVVCPDLRGYGESAATEGTVTMRELAADVEALLDELEIDAAAVVGLSMGGLVAMELAIANPGRWWALGLVATTAAPVTEAERRERLATAETIDAEGMQSVVDSMGPRLFGAGVDSNVVDRVAKMMQTTNPLGAAAALFEPAWSTRTVEDDPSAPFFNDTPKYVVSSTLTEPTWRNSEILGPYDPGAIRRLKDEVEGDVYTSGSGMLVRAMLADGLVDELHLFVYPLARATGNRLFGEDEPVKLELAHAEKLENGAVYLNYRPAG